MQQVVAGYASLLLRSEVFLKNIKTAAIYFDHPSQPMHSTMDQDNSVQMRAIVCTGAFWASAIRRMPPKTVDSKSHRSLGDIYVRLRKPTLKIARAEHKALARP